MFAFEGSSRLDVRTRRGDNAGAASPRSIQIGRNDSDTNRKRVLCLCVWFCICQARQEPGLFAPYSTNCVWSYCPFPDGYCAPSEAARPRLLSIGSRTKLESGLLQDVWGCMSVKDSCTG